eukprot:SAG25_NODE_2684_length_1451_cov_1.105769_3_plen_107_part_01
MSTGSGDRREPDSRQLHQPSGGTAVKAHCPARRRREDPATGSSSRPRAWGGAAAAAAALEPVRSGRRLRRLHLGTAAPPWQTSQTSQPAAPQSQRGVHARRQAGEVG